MYINNTFVIGNQSFVLFEFLKQALISPLHGSEYHLWFVYTLLGLYLLVPILSKWVKNASNHEIRYFLIIWLITFLYGAPVINKYLPNFNLINFSGYIGYFVLGYYLSKYRALKKHWIIGFILIGTLSTILGTYYSTYAKQAFMDYYYSYLTFNVAITSAGVFLLFKQYPFRSKRIKEGLLLISKHSFGIYLSHVLVLSLLAKTGLYWNTINPIISIPITTIACVSISTFMIFLGNKVKFLNFLIG